MLIASYTFFYLFAGLELNKELPIAKFLSDAKIVPGAVYQTEDILQAVKSQLNVSKMKILVISDRKDLPRGPKNIFLYEFKVEKILKGSLDLIPSPSPSVNIQIRGGKSCLMCISKTLR